MKMVLLEMILLKQKLKVVKYNRAIQIYSSYYKYIYSSDIPKYYYTFW